MSAEAQHYTLVDPETRVPMHVMLFMRPGHYFLAVQVPGFDEGAKVWTQVPDAFYKFLLSEDAGALEASLGITGFRELHGIYWPLLRKALENDSRVDDAVSGAEDATLRPVSAIAQDVYECARSWARGVRLIGNVRADELAYLAGYLLGGGR